MRLKCPNCRLTGQIRVRIKTQEAVCYGCGHIGPKKEFEEKERK